MFFKMEGVDVHLKLVDDGGHIDVCFIKYVKHPTVGLAGTQGLMTTDFFVF